MNLRSWCFGYFVQEPQLKTPIEVVQHECQIDIPGFYQCSFASVHLCRLRVRHNHICTRKVLFTYIRRSTPCVVEGLFTAQRGSLTFVGVVKALENNNQFQLFCLVLFPIQAFAKISFGFTFLNVTWSNGPVLRFLGDFWRERNIFSLLYPLNHNQNNTT